MAHSEKMLSQNFIIGIAFYLRSKRFMQLTNSYIVSKAFGTFLFASIMTGLAKQLRVIADSVIVSNFVDPNALSAINLYYPLETLFIAIVAAIIFGSSIHAAEEIGKQNAQKVSEYFSSALLVALPVMAVLVGASYLFFPQLINLLADADEPLLCSLTGDYAFVMLLNFVPFAFIYLLQVFTSIDGHPGLVTISIIVSLVLNVLLDLLLTAVIPMGIAGAAWATVISNLIGLTVLLPNVLKGKSTFKFVLPKKPVGLVVCSLKQGVPLCIGDVLLAILVFVLNQMVLDYQGPSGAYLFAIMMQIIFFGGNLLEGVADLNNSIGGVLLGERDYSGFRTLIHRSCTVVLVFGVILTLLTMLWPEGVVKLFGDAEEGVAVGYASDLRIIGLFIIPYLLFIFNTDVHILVKKEFLSSFFLFLQFILMIAIPWLFVKWAGQYFWWSFPTLTIIILLMQLGVALLLHFRTRSLSKVCLLPLLPDEVGVNFSLKYTEESIQENLEKIRKFLSICELKPSEENRIVLCCEELAYNVYKYSADNASKHFFDIRITDLEKSIEVRIKDAGKPFDPVTHAEKSAAKSFADGDEVHLGLQLVNNLCSHMSYKYMFGLNVTVLLFDVRRDG